jgi:hypothetical protein
MKLCECLLVVSEYISVNTNSIAFCTILSRGLATVKTLVPPDALGIVTTLPVPHW